MKKLLIKLNACSESIEWVGDRTPVQAWAECERADWMLWLLERKLRLATKRQIVLIACDIAEAALKYVPAGEDRPRLAIEAARAYIDKKITMEKLNAAWSAARAAAEAARDAAEDAWAAAWAAAGAAAWDAAGAARAAAWAAGDAGSAAWDAANKQQADTIRRHIPTWPMTLSRSST